VHSPSVRRLMLYCVATVVLATGCAGTGESQSSGAPQEDDHNKVDVMFAQMMVPHHDDAIAMATYIGEVDSVDPRVGELADTIATSQAAENAEMNDWLGRRGYAEATSSPGEINAGALGEASVEEVEAAFLGEMIAHHEHGVDMAEGAALRGESPAMVDLAQTMADDQTEQIETMRDLLGRQ